MGQCVARRPHSCGSREGLQIFEDDDKSLNGFCFSCKTYVKHPLGNAATIEDIPKAERIGKTKEEIAAEIEEIHGYRTVSLPTRKLRDKFLEKYGIKIGFDQSDGKTPAIAYFPYKKDG
jgi:hypothetical protein